jgi:outer membrane protein
MKKLSVLFLFMLIGFSAFAQQDNQWTLEECIEYAHQHNLRVKQSQLEMMSTKVELDRSKADLFPTLNAASGFSNYVGRSIDPFTNDMIDDPVTSQNYNVNSGITLFNGFSLQNTIKQSKVLFKANEFELAQMKNDISMQIVTAYTNILFNKELLAQAESQLQTTQAQLDRTRRQVEVGVLPQASLYEIQAQYASNELNLTTAQNNLELARLNLKQLLQLPAETPIDVVDPDIELTEVYEYPVSAREVYEVAEQTQPGVAAADARIESSELGVRVAKGNLLPSLTAQAGLGTRYSSAAPAFIPREGSPMVEGRQEIGYFLTPEGRELVYEDGEVPQHWDEFTYGRQLDFNFQRYVQVNLNIPIFNGFRTRSNVSQARIRQDQAQLQSQIVRQDLRQTIEQAAQDVKAAALTYRSNANQVKSLREAFRSVEQRFNLGAANPVEYNTAKNNLDVAESNLIRAKYDYVFKTKILDFYQNKPLSFD